MVQRGQVPSMQAKGLGQKGLGLEAGEGRVVLDKQPATVSQHQTGALGGERFLPQPEPMGRSVVLHLLAGAEGIEAAALFRAAQRLLPDEPGQGALRTSMSCSSLRISWIRTPLPRQRR